MFALLAPAPPGTDVCVQLLDDAGLPVSAPRSMAAAQLPDAVRALEDQHHPRWVWDHATRWYPRLLAAGVSVERCHDLVLCRNILAHSHYAAQTGYGRSAAPVAVLPGPAPETDTGQGSLFEPAADPGGPTVEELAAELTSQLQAVASSLHTARLTLLLAAESAAALVAAEMQYAGIPWRTDVHRKLLADQLGPEPAAFTRPEKMEALVSRLRLALDAPALNPDSPAELTRALHRAGIEARSTRSWELERFSHPAIAPLLAYRKLSRLFSANGWSWLDSWVRNGRFHAEYVVGAVVSGRWASRGGGALQIPKQVRDAVRADPGWKLIVADAAQLEPRILIAMSQDTSMASAARGKDLYAGLAAQGFGGKRAAAKVALLGAIYGATSGESGKLVPQLARAYPRAVQYVEDAARAGERGETVTTWLGRSTPPPSAQWWAQQRADTAEEQRSADAAARSRGRFTRNFVVQGTAAEWACCWLAELRRRMRTLGAAATGAPDTSGAPLTSSALDTSSAPELVFFLHDEVMVHCPAALVDAVTVMVQKAARSATRLLFGDIPLELPVSVAVVDSYADAK